MTGGDSRSAGTPALDQFAEALGAEAIPPAEVGESADEKLPMMKHTARTRGTRAAERVRIILPREACTAPKETAGLSMGLWWMR